MSNSLAAEMDVAQTPESAPAGVIRLSIAHLLLWMAGTGLVVALFPTGWLSGPDFVADPELFFALSRQRQTLERLSVVVVAPCYGAAVASLLVAGARLLTRRPGFPALPGHWPLVNLGLWVLIVGTLANGAPERNFSSYNLHVVSQSIGVPLVILLMLLLAVAIQAVIVVQEPRRWRWVLRWQLATAVVPVVALVMSKFEHGGTLQFAGMLVVLCWYVAALVAVIAGLWDFVRRDRFDLFHWVGIVSLFGILAHPPLTWLIADVAF